MTDILIYLALPVAVWRITHLISAEDGPFELIYKLRKALGNAFLGKLMDCFYCSSIWTGLAAAIVVTRSPIIVLILCMYYSGIAILLEKLTNKSFT